MSITGVLYSCMIVGASVWFQEESILKKNEFISLFSKYILINSRNYLTVPRIKNLNRYSLNNCNFF